LKVSEIFVITEPKFHCELIFVYEFEEELLALAMKTLH